ncbi:DUF504 domain-containing protein [Candidatus Woesearchaeota archaeon]|nr:DUF504 domain-containing protein [Candidatus Woesearchaeota archaeon]
MRLRESDKHFFWSLFGGTGIILFWRGIWEGSLYIPILDNVWVSLSLGLIMLTFSGIIFREFDPLGGLEEATVKVLHHVHHHPQKKEFMITYHDKLKKKDVQITAEHLHLIEKNVLSFHVKGKETFVPIHRIRAVHRKKELIWRL